MLEVLLTVFENMNITFQSEETYNKLSEFVDRLRKEYDMKQIFQDFLPTVDKYFKPNK